MSYDLLWIIGSYIAAFAGGLLAMLILYWKRPSGTIVIEKRTESDVFRFEMPMTLEEIEKKKKIIFKVKVIQGDESK